MDKYKMITLAEEQFAREVTLGVIIQRPLPALLYIIPGMFFIEFLRRGSAIRKYTKHFMFPRKLALLAAQALLMDEDEHRISSRIETQIHQWLTSLKLYSQDLAAAQKAAVELLREHYQKMLKADGETFHDLIKNAYPSKEDYQAYIRELNRAEKHIDHAIIGTVGENTSLIEKMLLEAQQVEKRHNTILEEIY
jgi:hypothetical protein